MADLESMRNECTEMLSIFETLLTSYDPAEMDPDCWEYKVCYAWDDLNTCIERMINRPKDKALHGLVKVTGLDDSYYMHNVSKEEKLLTDLSREVPRKGEPDTLLCEANRHGKVSISLLVAPCLVAVMMLQRSQTLGDSTASLASFETSYCTPAATCS